MTATQQNIVRLTVAVLLALAVFMFGRMNYWTAGAQRDRAHTSGTTHGPGSFFMVLGDSSTTGFQHLSDCFSQCSPPSSTTSRTSRGVAWGDWKCNIPSLIPSGRLGWACNLWSQLRQLRPSITVEKFGINGEDSCSMITGNLCPGSTVGPPGRNGSPPYNFRRISQLHAALGFLRAHPNAVSPILLAIGGNDPTGTMPGQVIRSAFERMVSNDDHIVRQLRAAAPQADLLLLNYSDPVLPGDLQPGGFITLFDRMIASEAVKYGAFPVDIARPTQYWHASFANPDGVHASDTGQRQTAEIIWSAYNSYLHGRTPLPLVVRPGGTSLRVGRAQTFDYATAPHAHVSLSLSFSRGTQTMSGAANGSGRWHTAWSTSHHKGKVIVHACAASGGSSLCVDEYFILTLT